MDAGPWIAVGLLACIVLGSAAAPLLEGAVGSGKVEAEALAVVKSAELSDLRSLPKGRIEQLVNRSWWSAARALIARSHEAHLDFTAQVRDAVASMKHEADVLLRWLDPQFANPPKTPMAMQWAQNGNMVMLAARFAPKWGGIGANLAVFSSEHGQGHIDHERTFKHVQDLLRVSITSKHIQADITAESGNTRKHYILSVDLYAEALPEKSTWSVEFQHAQGSMQMSHGAEIPQLHFSIMKREESPWPRLTANEPDVHKISIGPWTGAPRVDVSLPPFGGTQDQEKDKLPYVLGVEGGNACPSECTTIRDVEGCRAAALSLGLRFDDEILSPSYPMGCLMGPPPASVVYLNSHRTGASMPHVTPICEMRRTEDREMRHSSKDARKDETRRSSRGLRGSKR